MMQSRQMPRPRSVAELLAPSPLIDTEALKLIAAVQSASLRASSSSAASMLNKLKGYVFLARELENVGRHQHARRIRLAKAFAACEAVLRSYVPLAVADE
jgi:hypothetical protein